MHSIHWIITNYLITESEALPYWPSNSEVNTVGQGLRFSRNNQMVKVIEVFYYKAPTTKIFRQKLDGF